MTASATVGRALRYAEGSARGLLHHHRGHGLDEGPHVIGLVNAQRDAALGLQPVDQGQGRLALGVPVAWVTVAPTTRPLRFSISTWPMKARREGWPSALR